MEESLREELMTLAADTEWVEQTRCRNFVRDLPPFTIDEPEELGGSNQGANPLETILAALNSCTAIVVQLVAQEMGLTLRGLDIHAEGDLDPRGFLGQAEVKPYFLAVRQRVNVEIDCTEDQLAQLREAVARRCPAFNLIRDAGVPVEVEWQRS
ncbi:MAG: OsmC family protein [Clostridia bacterium]|nr:OsmC family protein [Clostridia bacterium]